MLKLSNVSDQNTPQSKFEFAEDSPGILSLVDTLS